MKIIKAPEPLPVVRHRGVVPKSIFLAGSIEMGVAEDWQTSLTSILGKPEYEMDCDFVFNPRRDSWDSSWVQSVKNPQFNEQVSWEMTALDIAQVIVMYFDPSTKSPISLLELGMYASSEKMIVCCPDGFWRKGNVEMVCDRFDIPLFNCTPNNLKCLPCIRDMLKS